MTRLWGSRDAEDWERLDLRGVADGAVIDAIWGASGSYWLVGRASAADRRSTLWRSADGLSWQASLALGRDFVAWSIDDGCPQPNASDGRTWPLFLTGTTGVDGVIWRSPNGGQTWTKANVDDVAGWLGAQDSAPVDIRGVVATSDGLLAFGNGLTRASSTSGSLHSRFWRSDDEGITWSRVPNTAVFGRLHVLDGVANGQVTVAVGTDVTAPNVAFALLSNDGGRTWLPAATPQLESEGRLAHVFTYGRGFGGLGFASPAAVDAFPLRSSAWTSDDGASWRTLELGALDGGIVEDTVPLEDRIIAVGRAWTTSATGRWDAPFGPAVWTLDR